MKLKAKKTENWRFRENFWMKIEIFLNNGNSNSYFYSYANSYFFVKNRKNLAIFHVFRLPEYSFHAPKYPSSGVIRRPL